MEGGVFSSRMRLTRDVRALNKTRPLPSADARYMSLRCWSFNPSGPPAEPLGKECMALATSPSTTEMVWDTSTDGSEMMASVCGCGLFLLLGCKGSITHVGNGVFRICEMNSTLEIPLQFSCYSCSQGLQWIRLQGTWPLPPTQ